MSWSYRIGEFADGTLRIIEYFPDRESWSMPHPPAGKTLSELASSIVWQREKMQLALLELMTQETHIVNCKDELP